MRTIADAIVRAADEVLGGALRDQFVVDVYQAGAGTSFNMNVNEVLANRAAEILGGTRGDYQLVHPNDHVNMSQSTNDVFPTATRLALLMINGALVASARGARSCVREKGRRVRRCPEGRPDAPAGRGADDRRSGIRRLRGTASAAAPTKSNMPRRGCSSSTSERRRSVPDSTQVRSTLRSPIRNLSRYTGLPLKPAANRFRVTQSMGDVVSYSGAMRRLSVELGKIASDLRLLSMGPRAGVSEIILPAVQPGSSIMPGKVNPSVPEMVNQVCYQVMGCDLDRCRRGRGGTARAERDDAGYRLEYHSCIARILRESMNVLRTRCVEGIEVDAARCRELLDRSTAMATALSPYLGYAQDRRNRQGSGADRTLDS